MIISRGGRFRETSKMSVDSLSCYLLSINSLKLDSYAPLEPFLTLKYLRDGTEN